MPRYKVLIEFDAEAEDCPYVVSVPALPGCFTHGSTVEEAIERAHEAIQVHLEGIIEAGEAIPEEVVAPQLVDVDVTVDVPAPA
jgi:predicted RNase H-like HicB family nuclease